MALLCVLYLPPKVSGMTVMDQVLAPDGMTQSQMRQQIQALLLGGADNIILGTIIFVAGLVAISVFCARRKLKAGLLLWFGLIALLYGVRLLASADAIHLLVGMPETFWRYLILFIGYLILIPFMLFFEQIYGRGWKSSLRGMVWIQALYAVAAILTDTIRRSPESLPDPVYPFFMGLTAVLVLGRYFAYQPPLFEESRAISVGLFIFILFVVNEHLVSMELVPWSLRLEALGFLLFVILLGLVAVRRFIKEYSHLPADRFADSLLHDLAAWSGRKAGRAQEDDLTLIVVDIA
jgi:hypothetical protein